MKSNQICLLLENHKMFSSDEIKLAAKMKVKNDKSKSNDLSLIKYSEYDSLAAYQRQGLELSLYDIGIQQRSSPYMGLFGGA